MTPLQNSNILKVEPAELVMFEGSEFLGIAESKEKFHVIFFYCRKFCKIRNNLENLHVFYFYLEENLQLSPIVWRKHHKGSVSLFKTIFISLVFIHRDNYTSFFLHKSSPLSRIFHLFLWCVSHDILCCAETTEAEGRWTSLPEWNNRTTRLKFWPADSMTTKEYKKLQVPFHFDSSK